MLIMSLLVLIAKTVCVDGWASNYWHMYELLVFFSLASTKKQLPTVQRSLTLIKWLHPQPNTYFSLKTSCPVQW